MFECKRTHGVRCMRSKQLSTYCFGTEHSKLSGFILFKPLAKDLPAKCTRLIPLFGYTDERHVSGIYGNPTRLAHRINRITGIAICYISGPSSVI